jgi:hypothetical protein
MIINTVCKIVFGQKPTYAGQFTSLNVVDGFSVAVT